MNAKLGLGALVIVAACGGEGRVAKGGNAVAARMACPWVVSGPGPATWWRREVFEGCSPPGFDVDGVVCEGACPMPCRAAFTGENGEYDWTKTMTWEDGRLVAGSAGGRHGWSERCEYRDGKLAGCDTRTGRLDIRRDAQGRIVAVDEGTNGTIELAYDEQGRVATLTGRKGLLGTRLIYDPAGRLAGEASARSEVEYGYDLDGRLHTSSLGRMERRYDKATGLLAEAWEMVASPGAGGTSRRVTTFTYDAKRRPTQVVVAERPAMVTAGPSEPRPTYTYTYEYDCAAK